MLCHSEPHRLVLLAVVVNGNALLAAERARHLPAVGSLAVDEVKLCRVAEARAEEGTEWTVGQDLAVFELLHHHVGEVLATLADFVGAVELALKGEHVDVARAEGAFGRERIWANLKHRVLERLRAVGAEMMRLLAADTGVVERELLLAGAAPAVLALHVVLLLIRHVRPNAARE